MSDMPPPPPPPNVEIVAVQPPRDYMALAIVATIVGLCTSYCIGVITGIIAIVMASKSRKAYAMGDVVTGASAASTAKTMIIVTFVIALLGIIVNIILFATGNFYYSFNTG